MNLERVKKAKEGDVEETANLIMYYTKSMYRLAFSILKNEDEIYDAISNTTVIVFEKISTLKKEEFFKTWLMRILINECYKIYNLNKKVVYLETANQESELVYNDTYIDYEIRNLVKELNPEFKEVVILYYFEDFSVKEIAQSLDIAEGTVKSRLSRARKQLEEKLIKNEDTYTGYVQGSNSSDEYRVTIRVDEDDNIKSMNCTCPYESNCKHEYATIMYIRNNN